MSTWVLLVRRLDFPEQGERAYTGTMLWRWCRVLADRLHETRVMSGCGGWPCEVWKLPDTHNDHYLGNLSRWVAACASTSSILLQPPTFPRWELSKRASLTRHGLLSLLLSFTLTKTHPAGIYCYFHDRHST
jgi:hypothetical protein